jgi:Protein kinase domain
MSPDLSEGQSFGAYHLIGVAGAGGMGIVYRAEQRPLGRIVALKVIRPDIASSGDYRARFLREARLAAAVNHPHIVPVFDCGEEAGQLYLTMQWIDGVELQQLIGGQQRLDPERAVRIGTQIASALGAVHDAGMLHRDIKPANILVRDLGGEDHAYLTDFGIAKIPEADGGLTRTGWMIGTSGYLSPEQIQGQQPDARSDLYALGCVMFAALTGQRPFAAESDHALLWAHASRPRPVASQACPGLGRRYDDFLIRALAVDPGERYQSGAGFAAALAAAHRGRAGTRAATELAAPVPPPLPTQAARPAPGSPAPGSPAPGSPAPGSRPAPGGSPGPGLRPAPGSRPAAGSRPAPVGGRPPAGAPRARGRASGYAGRLAVVAGCLVLGVSVTVTHQYVDTGGGWKSLWQATHGDVTSPLYPKDFWIPAALAAFALIVTVATFSARGRLAMGMVTVAALATAGYLLYLPAIGAAPGLRPFGMGYWLSVGAAAVMVAGAVAAVISSRARRGPARSP